MVEAAGELTSDARRILENLIESMKGEFIVEKTGESSYVIYTGLDPRLLEYYNSTGSRAWKPVYVLAEVSATEYFTVENFMGYVSVGDRLYDVLLAASLGAPELVYDRSSGLLEALYATPSSSPVYRALALNNSRVYVVERSGIPDVLIYAFNVTGIAVGGPIGGLGGPEKVLVASLAESSVTGFYTTSGGGAGYEFNPLYPLLIALFVGGMYVASRIAAGRRTRQA